MADRTDIDALLISALYGELTPADEARLTAHLESHPADRTTLADLTRTREAVRDSRFLAAQIEPPQAVSARLLQEAARWSPRPAKRDGETAGWLQRIMRSFIVHPAMAATAMLVLVVGVAGTVYLRRGPQLADFAPHGVSDFAPHGVSEPAATSAAAPVTTVTVNGSANVPGAAGSASYGARLDESAGRELRGLTPSQASDGNAVMPDNQVAAAPAAAPRPPASPSARPLETVRDATSRPAAKEAKAAKKSAGGIELRRAEPTVKDLDEESLAKGAGPARSAEPRQPAKPKAQPAPDNARATESAGLVIPSTVSQAPAAEPPVDRKSAKPSKNDAPPAAQAAAPPPPPSSNSNASNSNAQKLERDRQLDKTSDKVMATWAQKQHDQVVAFVRSNNCVAAANAATEIYNRAPDYYASNVANDRAVKPCQAYLPSEQRKAAAKRALSTEPVQAAPTQK